MEILKQGLDLLRSTLIGILDLDLPDRLKFVPETSASLRSIVLLYR